MTFEAKKVCAKPPPVTSDTREGLVKVLPNNPDKTRRWLVYASLEQHVARHRVGLGMPAIRRQRAEIKVPHHARYMGVLHAPAPPTASSPPATRDVVHYFPLLSDVSSAAQKDYIQNQCPLHHISGTCQPLDKGCPNAFPDKLVHCSYPEMCRVEVILCSKVRLNVAWQTRGHHCATFWLYG